MKKRINFRVILSMIGSLTIMGPLSLTVVACGFKETKQESESVDGLVVEEINKIIYSKEVALDSKADDLKNTITASFIVGKLPLEIKKIFENDLFILNKITDSKGEILTDDTFKVPGIVNAKINYDYGDFKNQSTNLRIDVQDKRLLLSDALKDFKFKDEKGVEDFLDTNALSLITKQIENYLSTSLDQAGLTLANRTSNSIILKAKPNSKKYRDEVKLTWNLKLFEIYGIEINVDNIWLKKGLKGYFYLETGTNQIKYFDVMKYFFPATLTKIHNYFKLYHQFIFKNQNNEEKYFIFKGDWWTSTVSKEFETFDFTKEVRVTIDSPELSRIKFFNTTNNKWAALIEKETFLINSLGQVIRKS